MKGVIIDLGERYNPSVNRQQFLAHQAPERYILYGGAYGGGKTAWLVNEVIRLSVMYGGNKAFIGCRDGTDFKRNAYNQLLKFLAPELYTTREYRDSKGRLCRVEGLHHQSDMYFKLINGSMIYYGGIGNEAEAVKKISNMPELGVIGIDQAEEITENQFLLLDGRLRLAIAGIRYKLLLTANPDPGWLRARFIEEARPDHRYIPALPKDNPFLPAGYEEKLKETYPPEMVKRLLEGDWDVPGIDLLIPYTDIRDAINRNMPASGPAVGGLDVSEFGESRTVFIARQGHKVIDIVSWAHMDTEFSAGVVAELIRKHKLLTLNIDTIGKGGEVYVLLKNDFNVRAIVASEKASKEDRYVNCRAEHYGNLAKRFEMGEIDIPDHRLLASQLASLKKRYPKGKLQIESKELMKKRGLKSPDFADALALAFISPISKEIKKVHVYSV